MHDKPVWVLKRATKLSPSLDKQADLCQVPFRYEIYTKKLNAEGITTFSSKILPVTVFLPIWLAEGKLNQ